jgi:hypothetical protein
MENPTPKHFSRNRVLSVFSEVGQIGLDLGSRVRNGFNRKLGLLVVDVSPIAYRMKISFRWNSFHKT